MRSPHKSFTDAEDVAYSFTGGSMRRTLTFFTGQAQTQIALPNEVWRWLKGEIDPGTPTPRDDAVLLRQIASRSQLTGVVRTLLYSIADEIDGGEDDDNDL